MGFKLSEVLYKENYLFGYHKKFKEVSEGKFFPAQIPQKFRKVSQSEFLLVQIPFVVKNVLFKSFVALFGG